MQDRISKFPGRVRLTPVDGQENVFDLVRADEPEVEGTPLNKGNLLSDDTATLFGLFGGSATPDGAFKAIKDDYLNVGNLHVWNVEYGDGNSRYLTGETRDSYTDGIVNPVAPYYDLKELSSGFKIMSAPNNSTRLTVYRTNGDANVIVNADGSVDLSNISETSLYATSSYVSYLKGYYFKYYSKDSNTTTDIEAGKIYYIPSNANVTITSSNDYIMSVDIIYEVVGHPGTFSKKYTYIGQLGEGSPKIAFGSYKGTNTYGASNPCSITVDFAPKLLWLHNRSYNSRSLALSSGSYLADTVACDVLTTSYVANSGFVYDNNNGSTYTKKSADGKTITWYHNQDAIRQFNDSTYTYCWIAIG